MLTPAIIQRYYTDKLKNGRLSGKGGLSPRTVRHHHTTLHTALESAMKWELLGRNPADAVDAPRYSKTEMKILDEVGLRCIIDGAKDTMWFPIFYTALFTGARRSEVLALCWSDVHPTRKPGAAAGIVMTDHGGIHDIQRRQRPV